MEISKIADVLTKEQLLEKVHTYENSQPVDIELGTGIRFQTSTENENEILLNYNGEVSILNPPALGNLTANIGFPRPYLKKVPPEEYATLVLPHLNYWYREALNGKSIRLLKIDNRIIMVIPKTNFEHIKISDIINAAEHQLGTDQIAGYHKIQVTPETVCFSILTPREIEIKEGDIFNSGIRINHSLSGEVSTSLSAYLFRQWCSNGATTEDELQTWHRNSSSNLETWLQSSIVGANSAFDKETERVKNLLQIPMDGHTGEVLNSILNQSGVPQKLQTEVRTALLDTEAHTLYDVYNMLTKIDTHSKYFEEHPNSMGSLDKVAVHLTHNSELCPTCHRQIK